MGKAERQIENYLDLEVRKLNGFTRKIVCQSHKGMPDRLVVLPMYMCLVEAKTEVGTLSSAQKREIERLYKRIPHVYVVNSVKGVDQLINSYKAYMEDLNEI